MFNQNISLQRTTAGYPAEYRRLLIKEPKFGTVFTDHMVTAK